MSNDDGIDRSKTDQTFMKERAKKIGCDRIRGERGLFVKGNPGSPGRKPRVTETAYVLETAKGCSVDDWREITKKIVELAKAGEMDAVKFLASYLLGPAKSDVPRLVEAMAIEVTGLDPIEATIEGLQERQTILRRRAMGIF